MASTIRLLAVIEAFTITGPAKNLLQFAQLARLPSGGCDVRLAVFQRPGTPTVFLEVARQCSIPVHLIPESGRIDTTVLRALGELVRDLRPDILQTHAVKSHFLVRKAGIYREVPWIAFHHGYTTPDLKVRLYNQLDRWSLRKARRVITVSLPFRQEVIRKGVPPDRVEVVHNAIDPRWGACAHRPEAAARLRAQLGIGASAKVVLLVGRMSREKDHLTLLRAVARMRSRRPLADIHLLLVGDGPERARIENAAAALGIEPAVTLTGQVPSAEPYYGIADIAALSSLTEGSPNALLEAMAAGIPVVATAVGGIPEIIRDRESAILVAPGDAVAMAAALDAILLDPPFAQQLVDKARQIIASRHTPAARAARLIEIYRATLVS